MTSNVKFMIPLSMKKRKKMARRTLAFLVFKQGDFKFDLTQLNCLLLLLFLIVVIHIFIVFVCVPKIFYNCFSTSKK